MSTPRTAAITGSASGIGAAIRARLEADGWRVIGIDLAGQEIDGRPRPTARGPAAAVAAVLGADRRPLDALVPCAGLGPQVPDRAPAASRSTTSARSPCSTGCFPALQAGDAAAAVLICSNSISMTPDARPHPGRPHGGRRRGRAPGPPAPTCDGPTVYAMTKVALGRAARQRVQAWGEAGVRLNLVAPGPVTHPAAAGHPRRRRARASSSTCCRSRSAAWPSRPRSPGPVAFLLGPDASNIHGSVLFADGGSDALFRPDHV